MRRNDLAVDSAKFLKHREAQKRKRVFGVDDLFAYAFRAKENVVIVKAGLGIKRVRALAVDE